MSKSERAVATEVDGNLQGLGLNRNTAPTATVAALTALATAKQHQIDLNNEVKQSDKDAASEAKKAAKDRVDAANALDRLLTAVLRRADPVGGALASLEQDVLTLDLAFDKGKIGPEEYKKTLDALYKAAEAGIARIGDKLKNLAASQDAATKSVAAQAEAMAMSSENLAGYLARIDAENRLIAEGIPLIDERAQAYIRSAEATAKATSVQTDMIEQERASQEVWASFAENSFGTIGNAITAAFATGQIEAVKFRDITRSILSELIQLALRLSVINPLENGHWAGTGPRQGAR